MAMSASTFEKELRSGRPGLLVRRNENTEIGLLLSGDEGYATTFSYIDIIGQAK